MNEEELLVKLKFDISSLKQTLNQVKNEVSNIESAINTATSGSTASATAAKKTEQATSKLSTAIKKLNDGIQKIKGMSFGGVAEMAADFAAAEYTAKRHSI